MAVGKEVRGPLWVDGQFTVRVRGAGTEPGRVLRIRRPFALVGQIPGADIRIDHPAVDGRHAFLMLDRRGIFGVDLLTKTGTRFAGAASAAAWLGAGDILEIAGRRVELLRLRVDGQAIDPPLPSVDLLTEAETSGLVDLTLEPLDAPGPPWMLGSALAFVGRGEACAIRIENASASRTHCALLRGASAAYAIDLLGRRTLVNERPIEGASALLDGDVLTIGQARFAVRIDHPSPPSIAATARAIAIESTPDGPLVRLADAQPGSRGLALNPREAMLSLILGAADATGVPSSLEILDTIRQFRADTATLLEAQIERIETLHREIASLKEEIRAGRVPTPPPAPPLRLDLKPPQATPPGQSANWLLDRLNTLEDESRSTWKDLLGRITSSVAPKTAPAPPASRSPPPTPGRPGTTRPEIAQD